MSYVDLNWDFSQFDRDNTDRFQAAAYINNANALAEEIQADPDAAAAADELAAGRPAYGQAKAALAAHDYAATFENARAGLRAGPPWRPEAGVQVEASENGRTADLETPRRRARYRAVTLTSLAGREGRAATGGRDAADIEVQAAQDFSPLAHRLRR